MEKNLTRVMFVILYTLYTLVAVNTKLVDPIIPYGKFYVYLYLTALVVLMLLSYRDPLIIATRSISFRTMGLFTIYIFLFSIITYVEGSNSVLESEVYAFAKYIMVATLTVYFVKQFDLYSQLLLASFIGGSGILIYEFVLAGFPLDILSRIGTLFSNVYALRFRLYFNFNNPNTVGNIAACMLIVYWLLVTWTMKYEIRTAKRCIKLAIFSIMAVIDFLVLLSSGSRNSILTVIIFVVALCYFKVTESKALVNRQKKILKFIIGLFGIIIVYASLFSSLFEMFETSGRLKSFEVNIPILFENNHLLDGLGLMNPGLFGQNRTGYSRSYILDNYYLYVFLETGIIGLCMIGIMILRLARCLQLFRIRLGNYFVIVSAAFIAWLASGIGETCVLYPNFPSSLIFLILFLASIEKGETMVG